jgi:hypothetical protein
MWVLLAQEAFFRNTNETSPQTNEMQFGEGRMMSNFEMAVE